jgi:hypothetical protein
MENEKSNNQKETSSTIEEIDVFTKEYLQTCIRGTFKHTGDKCKFVEEPNGYYFLNPLSGEMVHITDTSII